MHYVGYDSEHLPLQPGCELIRCPYEEVRCNGEYIDAVTTYEGRLTSTIHVRLHDDKIVTCNEGEHVISVSSEFILYGDGRLIFPNDRNLYPTNELRNVVLACYGQQNLAVITRSNELNLYLPSVSTCSNTDWITRFNAPWQYELVAGEWFEHIQYGNNVTLLVTIPLPIRVCDIVACVGYLHPNLTVLCVTDSSDLVLVKLDGECEKLNLPYQGTIKEIGLIAPLPHKIVYRNHKNGVKVGAVIVCDDYVSRLVEVKVTYDTKPIVDCRLLDTGVLSASELQVVKYPIRKVPKPCSN